MIRIYAHTGPWSQRSARLFKIGLDHHGIDSKFGKWHSPEPADLMVFWGHKNRRILDICKYHGLPYLVMEAGYWPDRLYDRAQPKWISLGFNGLNGRALFNTEDAPGDRFAECGHALEKWNPDGDGYLIIGQVSGDAATTDADLPNWYRRTYHELRELTDEQIWFRNHPMGPWCDSDIPIKDGLLRESIEQAKCVITYNSNTAVEALLWGTPAISVDRGSMAYPVTAHAIADAVAPVMPDREQWVYNLAYSQWLEDEIAGGLAWEHLEKQYGRASENSANHRADRTG